MSTTKVPTKAERIAAFIVGIVGIVMLVSVGIYLFMAPEPIMRGIGGSILGMFIAMCAIMGITAFRRRQK